MIKKSLQSKNRVQQEYSYVDKSNPTGYTILFTKDTDSILLGLVMLLAKKAETDKKKWLSSCALKGRFLSIPTFFFLAISFLNYYLNILSVIKSKKRIWTGCKLISNQWVHVNMACKIKSSHSFCDRYANLDKKRERAPIFSPSPHTEQKCVEGAITCGQTSRTALSAKCCVNEWTVRLLDWIVPFVLTPWTRTTVTV